MHVAVAAVLGGEYAVVQAGHVNAQPVIANRSVQIQIYIGQVALLSVIQHFQPSVGIICLIEHLTGG